MKYNSNFLISKKTKEKKSIKTQFYGSVIKHARLATGEYNVNVHLKNKNNPPVVPRDGVFSNIPTEDENISTLF